MTGAKGGGLHISVPHLYLLLHKCKCYGVASWNRTNLDLGCNQTPNRSDSPHGADTRTRTETNSLEDYCATIKHHTRNTYNFLERITVIATVITTTATSIERKITITTSSGT
jgi:hypothetical protein